MKSINIFSVIILIFLFSTISLAGESLKVLNKSNAYFDTATGHKYIKVDSSNYAQFSRKGTFIKKVSSTFPRLQVADKVHPISENSYILYEKYSQGKFVQKVLPASSPHPLGWRTKEIFFSK